MPTNTLSDAKCKAAKPAEKSYKIFDGGGLYLFVTAKGAKVWRLSYRFEKKPQTISFGPYPEISLGEARHKRDEAKVKLRAGINPIAERKPDPAAKKSVTLREASSQYWSGRNDLSDSYRANATRGIAMHLFPDIWDTDVRLIDRSALMVPLLRMNAAGLYDYVRKVRMWVSQVFDWCVENEYMDINPAALIRPEKAFGKQSVEHFPALELREMPDFMRRLRFEADLQSVIACRMLAYTWVRTKELRFMEWAEVEDGLWLIPAGKMKRKLDHLVPLPAQACALLEQMKARSRGSKYVFPHEFRLDRPMSENAVLYLIGRIGYKGRMTGHGWRSVGSTWANEHGYNPDAIERQLAHVPENEVRSAYNRAKYLPDRRKMLQDWSDWLDSCEIDAVGAKGG